MRKAPVKKFCGACGDPLTQENWYPSLQRTNNGRCIDCYTVHGVTAYCTQCGLPLVEGTCLPCTPPRTCAKCGVELTDDNWQQTFKRRNVARCIQCHLALCAAWEAKNPGNSAKRQKDYHDRYPEKQVAYYQTHKEEYAQRAIERLWKLKNTVITQMGGQCVICGITDMRLLQINHLNGGGQQEQKFGQEMYQAIVSGQRTTDDLDVRCANHNLLYEYERGKRRTPAWFGAAEEA